MDAKCLTGIGNSCERLQYACKAMPGVVHAPARRDLAELCAAHDRPHSQLPARCPGMDPFTISPGLETA